MSMNLARPFNLNKVVHYQSAVDLEYARPCFGRFSFLDVIDETHNNPTLVNIPRGVRVDFDRDKTAAAGDIRIAILDQIAAVDESQSAIAFPADVQICLSHRSIDESNVAPQRAEANFNHSVGVS